ncbi:hydantoinase/oxoprolinase family protein [Aquamicrobium sp. LC103]|uniref:hydantoinase/oxoprolinase family protein n=1 Tax=Aquamicrobium sp. LC103 TaxID=1120658 RepID=UPI00063EA179|nr:hydantoinase/oxoprolinase family protein [Aquamicrobium sp. LC103]
MSTVLGIDIGGTFTDLILMRDDGAVVEKVPSTPSNPAQAIVDGLRVLKERHGVDLATLDLFCHGSTVATNALLESKLPATALVVTRGFRDVLEIGSMMRPSLFDLKAQKPRPIVPREFVFEVEERIGRTGEIDIALTQAAIDGVIETLRAASVRSVAICLLFSFRNDVHERALAQAIRVALPDVSVTVSTDVAPEINEYPRASTTAISAALEPLVARYIDEMRCGVVSEGLMAPVYVMQSSGGVMTAEETAVNAHRMILSGPAAGVLAAQRLAESTPYADMITFDMGGTSTDICLIKDARADLERESMFEGRPLRVPQFAIHTIGAGGGSIARVDAAGMLKVGPESSGAMPGPVCYGRGGTQPTVTDAHAVLGRIDPGNFLGGEMKLDVEAARRAIEERIAKPLGLSVEEAAQGILDIADAAMARGVRVVSVNKGHDPRDFALMPFGGAGAMHALTVGALVEVGRVVVPQRAGIFSAVGLASSDVKYDFIRIVEKPLDTMPPEEFQAIYEPLDRQAVERLNDKMPAGASIDLVRTAQLRYMRQDNKVEIELSSGDITAEALEKLATEFHEAHSFQFGHNDPEGRIELVSLSLEAFGRMGHARSEAMAAPPDAFVAAPRSTRRVYFRETGWADVGVYDRRDLKPGASLTGPAVVEEREATIIVTPDVSGRVDAGGNIILERMQAGATE